MRMPDPPKSPLEDPEVARAFVKTAAYLSKGVQEYKSENPQPVDPYQMSSQMSGCPVVGQQEVNQSNQMAPSPNRPSFLEQQKPLNQKRQVSSIPMEKDEEHWVYPSEQMFYNAMKRKGWNPTEEDMPAVVAIHNAVNERAWREILSWESHQGISAACGGPKLVKFRGRPKDFSPKARFLNMLGYKLPFDRHDWIVDRCGKQVRYVIDFYNGAPQPNMPAAMHLDVRPALDSPALVLERLKMQFKHMVNMFTK